MRLDDGEHARALGRLRSACEEARIVLSKGATAAFTLEALADEKDYALNLSRCVVVREGQRL